MVAVLYPFELRAATWLICCGWGLEHPRQSRNPAITRAKGLEPLTSALIDIIT